MVWQRNLQQYTSQEVTGAYLSEEIWGKVSLYSILLLLLLSLSTFWKVRVRNCRVTKKASTPPTLSLSLFLSISISLFLSISISLFLSLFSISLSLFFFIYRRYSVIRKYPPHNSLYFSLLKYSVQQNYTCSAFWNRSYEKSWIKGTVMQVNVIYALKPENWRNMQYKSLNICY